MRDLPDSRALLELVRSLLLDEVQPLVPPERRRDLHLAATAISLALREAEGNGWQAQVETLLRAFYGYAAADLDPSTLMARLAADLRNGEFETSPSQEKAARVILWRLVAGKLREANPQFLAANGYR